MTFVIYEFFCKRIIRRRKCNENAMTVEATSEQSSVTASSTSSSRPLAYDAKRKRKFVHFRGLNRKEQDAMFCSEFCKFIETNHTEFNLQVAMSKLYTGILYTDKFITVSFTFTALLLITAK